MERRGWLLQAIMAMAMSWKCRIWAAVLLGIALVLCQLPLFGVLGFEFSFVMAVVASVLGADLGASLVYRSRHLRTPAVERSIPPGLLMAQLIGGGALLAALLLLLPLLVVSVNALWVRNCDWLFGLRCYLLMPILSATLGCGLGVLAGIAAGDKRWLRRALPYGLLLLSVLLSLLHFYRSPAVFSYNAFAGYFPGNLYDESIDLRAPFYWARLYHFALLTGLASAFALFLDVPSLRLRRSPRPSASPRIRPLMLLVPSALLALTLHAKSGELRFSVDAEDIREALPGRYESEHFIIHYPADRAVADTIELIAADHEFRRAQLVRDMEVDPPGKITSFYFASPEQKHELMGARNVYMAKPWRHEIYVHHQGFPHQVLKHEIAHVMAGAFGDPLFEVSAGTVAGLPVFFNVGMIEGTAVAADWPDHFNKSLTPHQSVKAMQVLGMAPPAHRLFSTGFMAFSSARSYTLAGSYLRFLLDRFGMERLQRLYSSGGDFYGTYGRTQSDLSAEWEELIAATEIPEGAAELIRERFRHPAIFNRPCPHAIARARDRMVEQANRADYAGAISTARGVCRDVPEEPNFQLNLATLLALDGDYEEAAEIFMRIAKNAENISSSLRAHALFELVSIRMWQEREAEALALLEQILGMPVEDNDLRRAQVMREVFKHSGPAGPALRSIFWGAKPGREVDRLVVAGLAGEALSIEPELALAHYLLARQLRGRGDPEATRRALLRVLDSELTPLVERETARLLAEASFLAGAYADTERACAILTRPEQPQVIRLLGYDWLERLHWAREGQVTEQPLGWRDGVAMSSESAASAN